MINDIVSLSKKLIEIKSVPDNPQALEKALVCVIDQLQDFTIERFEQNGYKSILVYNTPKRPKKFKFILNGHVDIIPGKEKQYKPVVKNNRLYGLGVMDMKSCIASHVIVFKKIAKTLTYPIALQFVTDEELGGFHGTKYQIDQGVRTDFAIVGETTNFTIENETKGVLWVKISCKGKSAHGAYPWKGENAIWKMTYFLSSLEKNFPNPTRKQWISSINLAHIKTSNQTFNKVPDECEIWLDVRYIPQDSKVIVNKIKKNLPKGFKMEVVLKEPAQFVNKDNQYIQELQKKGKQIIKKNISLMQAMGSSDARHFTRVACDAVEFGPIGGGMGSDEEWVDIQSLEYYSLILKEFLESFQKK